jgi:hypothetical protein
MRLTAAVSREKGAPVIMFGPTCTTRSFISRPATPFRSERSTSWPSASTTEIGFERLELACGLREAFLVELHLLDGDGAGLDVLDR